VINLVKSKEQITGNIFHTNSNGEKMKIGLITLLLIVLSFSSNAQDINGSWKGTLAGMNGDMELVFTFKLDSDSLTGNVVSPMGELQLENGKVDGNNFSFDISVNGQVISHTCVLEGDIIKMSMPMMEQPVELSRVVEDSKINGKWKGTASSPQGDMELVFEFKVDGEKLTGTDTSPMGVIDISNGVVNGNDFSFDIDMGGMKISHKCKYLDSDSIEVVANVMDEDMVLTLTRADQ
jgi:mRNA-degrading endonuclease YafQ of YafQ-DinJ toxin-antitoxin module